MSLSRRFGRILRAQWGAWRHDALGESFAADDEAGWERAGEAPPDDEAPPGGDAPRETPRATPEEAVPPKVAAAYRALEVPSGSNRATVKKSYRRLMRAYHPDRFEYDPDRRATAHEVSQRLNDAYERVITYLDEREF